MNEKELLNDYIREVEAEIDLIDDEYQNGNPMLRDSIWGYHNRIRLIMIKIKQKLIYEKEEKK